MSGQLDSCMATSCFVSDATAPPLAYKKHRQRTAERAVGGRSVRPLQAAPGRAGRCVPRSYGMIDPHARYKPNHRPPPPPPLFARAFFCAFARCLPPPPLAYTKTDRTTDWTVALTFICCRSPNKDRDVDEPGAVDLLTDTRGWSSPLDATIGPVA